LLDNIGPHFRHIAHLAPIIGRRGEKSDKQKEYIEKDKNRTTQQEMAINWVLPVRAVQFVLSVVVLGLMAYGTFLSPFSFPTTLHPSDFPLSVSSWWSTHWRQSSPSEINYLIFAPSWSLLSLVPLLLLQLVPKFESLRDKASVKWALLGLEGLTMLFWFSGFVALAVFLSGRICFGMVSLSFLYTFSFFFFGTTECMDRPLT
jgi:hypothetical protein